MITTYITRTLTEEFSASHASLEPYVHRTRRAGRASAAIIVNDTSKQCRCRPVFAMHISHGHEIGAESVYTMEYLALAAAMLLLAHTKTLHSTVCDAKSVLDNIPGRRRKLQNIHKDHHFLLQCIDDAIHHGFPVQYHVRSHADDRKPKRDSRGRLGAGWTVVDWGNNLNDRVASG